MDDAATSTGALAIVKSDLSSATAWIGAYTVTGDGMVTITDAETKQNINFTIVDVTPRTSMTLDIEGYGEVQLKSVTEADFTAYAEDIAKTLDEGDRYLKQVNKAVKKAGKELTKEYNKLVKQINSLDENTGLFWDGTLADGSYVSYVDDTAKGEAALSIIKADYSDGVVYYGKYTAGQNGKTTLTDSETGATITYETAETTPGSAMTMTIDGYGTANLTTITVGDLKAFADEAAKYIEQAATAK